MKPFLFCGTFVTLLGLLNGSVLPVDVGTDLTRGYPGSVGYPVYELTGTVGNVGFTTNSAPYGYGTNFGTYYDHTCSHQITNEIVTEFRLSLYKFIVDIFKKTAALSEGHNVFSPLTMWLTLAAIAEGSEGPARQELFSILGLPEDRCQRQKFYLLATTREIPSDDVVLSRNRLFVTDSRVRVNQNWENLVRTQTHLKTLSIPFKTNPFQDIEALKRVFRVRLPNLNLNGNSFLLESLDYNGLWSSAFSDASIDTRPFYDISGQQIGNVEYMKMVKRVKIAYIPSANMKVIELPVGKYGRYKMLFGQILAKADYVKSFDGVQNSIVFEFLQNMRETPKPIEILIPRLTMTSELDIRKIMEEVGIKSLWTDPSATRNISDPAALPSAYIQRATVTIDNSGVRPTIKEFTNFVPPLHQNLTTQNSDDILNEFIANRPFVFGLHDSETYMVLFAASFSKLDYS